MYYAIYKLDDQGIMHSALYSNNAGLGFISQRVDRLIDYVASINKDRKYPIVGVGPYTGPLALQLN